MLRSFPRWAALAVLACAPSAGRAAVILETEAGGAAANNSVATAQGIPNSAFTAPSPPTAFGYNVGSTATIQGIGGGFLNGDVDFYSFTTGGNTFTFDIDGGADTVLSLFDSSGTLIAFSDDSFPADPGSADGFDAFIGEIFLGAGTHHVAVSSFPNLPNGLFSAGATAALTRPDGAEGGLGVFGATAGDSSFSFDDAQPAVGSPYTLHITQNPEPASLALWSLLGLAAAGYRRRRRTAG